MMAKYIPLCDLLVYQEARALSAVGWDMYSAFDWQTKKIMGDQFIAATDSVGANVAEGYGRYHYIDRIKFMYNARGSLIEASQHWLPLLMERDMITRDKHDTYHTHALHTGKLLQAYVSSLYRTRTVSKTSI